MNYYKVEPVDYQKTLDDVFAVADIITGMVADITTILDTARKMVTTSYSKVHKALCLISTTAPIRM